MPFFFAIVTIVLQKRAKLDYTRGGCYNEDKYGSISMYQNKVNFIKKEVQL